MDGDFWGWFYIDSWHWARYTTRDTTYVVVEEEYNNNHTRLTGWDVSVGDDSDIIEWVDGDWRNGVDEDGYMTLVSVVKSDDNDAQLVYIWKFDPEYRTRDITVTLDGTTDLGTQNVWWSDTAISGSDTEIGALDNQGYDFDSNIGSVVVDGNDWTISSIPTGYDDITINITSKHVDIEVNGNLTLNTMNAKDGNYDPYAGNIWGDGNTVSYNFVLNTADDIASVTWDETVYVDNGVENKQVSYEEKSATRFNVVGSELRVQGTAAPQYIFGSNDKVTVVIDNLKVTLVEDEPVYEKATNMLASVTVDSAEVELAEAYNSVAGAIANATKINMSSSATQEYKVVVETKESINAGINTYGGIKLYNSESAAQGFNATDIAFNSDGYTFSNVSVGSYLIINTNNGGTIAYYAYYFG